MGLFLHVLVAVSSCFLDGIVILSAVALGLCTVPRLLPTEMPLLAVITSGRRRLAMRTELTAEFSPPATVWCALRYLTNTTSVIPDFLS